MAYLDSAGNVADLTVRNWQEFTRIQEVLPTGLKIVAPATAVPAGAEKAIKGTH